MAKTTSKGLGTLSAKRGLVDKANTTVVVATAVAAALVVFAIFASLELYGKIAYQNEVIGHREDARDQLKTNQKNVATLNNSFIAWDEQPESIIGTPDNNSRIILDALPSKYDFPAFMSSIEFIIKGSGMTVESLVGTDQEVGAISSQVIPQVVPMPFSLTAKGDYEATKKLITDLQRSIRPFKISSIEASADKGSNQLTVSITGESYYQPSTEIDVQKQVVKKGQPFELQAETPVDPNLGGASN